MPLSRVRFAVAQLSLIALAAAACSSPDDAPRHVAAASQYAATGRLKEAVIEYRNALQLNPRLGQARLELAALHEQAGDMRSAYGEYVRAADLLPDNDAAQIKAGQFLLGARAFEDAQTRANRVLKRAPGNIDAHVLLAGALAGLDDADGAARVLAEAASLDPARSEPLVSLGYLASARGRTAEAERAFVSAVRAEPAAAAPRLALAEFLLANRRGVAAEQALLEALALDPGDAQTNVALAAFYLQSNRAPEAETYLKNVVTITGDVRSRLAVADYYLLTERRLEARAALETLAAESEAARVRLAGLHYVEGRRDAAYDALLDVLRRNPVSPSALLLRGSFRLRDHQPAAAVADFTKAATADSRSVTARMLLAAAYSAAGDAEEAVAAYREVLRINPRADDVHYELSRLYLASGRIDPSMLHAEKALASQPERLDARLVLAQSLVARGETERATTELQLILRHQPDAAAARAAMGAVHLANGRIAEARQWLGEALALDPMNLDALWGLVNADLHDHDLNAARHRVKVRVALTPNHPELLQMAAATLERTGDGPGAEAMLREAIRVDPSRMTAYVRLGRLYVSQGRLSEAKEEFRATLAQQSKPAGALTMIGVIEEIEGDVAAAEASYKKALEVDPSLPVPSNNLAWLLSSRPQHLDIALQLAQTAKRGLPDDPRVNDTLGWIYYKKGLLPQAVAAMRESVQHSPENPAFQARLGLAYLKAGDRPAARASLERAFTLGSQFEGADEARAALSALGS